MFETINPKSIVIRKCQLDELTLLFKMAEFDGRNPGPQDDISFYQMDPDAFFLALMGNEIVGSIAAIATDAAHGFIGLHMVHPEFRTTELSQTLLRLAFEKLHTHAVGINAHPQMVSVYQDSGFSVAHTITLYSGSARHFLQDDVEIVTPFAHPFTHILDLENQCYGFTRAKFNHSWLNQRGSLLSAILEDQSAFKGIVLMRPCISGYEISNLLSKDVKTALQLAKHSQLAMPEGSTYYMHIPDTNPTARELITELNLTPLHTYYRMYKNAKEQPQTKLIYSYTGYDAG